MKKRGFLLILFLSVFVFMPTYAAKWKAKHVILIGLDGWGAYSIPKAEMPNVKAMMQEGSYTLKSRSVLPSSSAVNWASMYMGAGPELHGFTEWGSQKPELPSRVITEKYGLFPSIFGLLRDACPKAVIGHVYEWNGMSYLAEKQAMDLNKHTPVTDENPRGCTDTAIKFIKESKPTLFAVIYDQPDGVGHGAGHDTEPYYEKLKELDGYIGEIVQAVKDAGIYDETIFILTADHGGIGKGHGGKTMREMEVPFIVCGKNIKKGYEFDESMMRFDTAPTIAYIFNLKTPQVWIGRPMKQIFK